MNRLFRSVCICMIVMGALCLAALAVGRGQPEGDFIPRAKGCDGAPCYMGIVLSKTTLTEATHILRQAGYVKHPDYPNTFESTGVIREMAFRTDNGRTIDGIGFYLREGALTAGSFVQRWGTPCAVYFGINSPTVTALGYPQAIVWLKTHDWTIELSSPAELVDIPWPDRYCIIL